MPFKFSCVERDLTVCLSGTLTFHQHNEGEQLIYQITTLVDRGEIDKVHLNFADTQRIDSHWLGVLIRILRRVKEKNAELIIENPNRDVSRLFGIVELHRIAEIRQ